MHHRVVERFPVRSSRAEMFRTAREIVFATGTAGAVAAATVPGTDAQHYGLPQPGPTPNGHLLLAGLRERPANYREPTAYISVSRALLPAAAIPYLQAIRPAANGELQVTAAFAADHDGLLHLLTGHYYDCGNALGLLTAGFAAARLNGRLN